MLELLLLAVQLGADARLTQSGSGLDSGAHVVGHRQDEYVRRCLVHLVVQVALLTENVEQTGQTDGDAHARQLLVGVVLGKVVVAAARADGTDFRMVEHGGLVNGAGVVVQTAGNRQVDLEVVSRNAERLHIGCNRFQLLCAEVEYLVLALVALQRRKDTLGAARRLDELQQLVSSRCFHAEILDQNGLYLLRADLLQLVDGAHHVAGLLGQTEDSEEAVEHLAVVDADLEALKTERGERLVDDARHLGLVDDVQLAVADDVDVRLIELAETAALCAFTAVNLADLETAEREGQLAVVLGNILCQRYGQIESQGQIAVALGEAVDLLFSLAAALGEQYLGGLDQRGIQRIEAVQRIGFAQYLHDALHLHLRCRKQLHKAG